MGRETRGLTPLLSLPWSADGIESRASFLQARPGHLLYDPAVAQEHKRRPKLDLKGPSEGFPFSIFDFDVPDAGIFLEESR